MVSKSELSKVRQLGLFAECVDCESNGAFGLIYWLCGLRHLALERAAYEAR